MAEWLRSRRGLAAVGAGAALVAIIVAFVLSTGGSEPDTLSQTSILGPAATTSATSAPAATTSPSETSDGPATSSSVIDETTADAPTTDPPSEVTSTTTTAAGEHRPVVTTGRPGPTSVAPRSTTMSPRRPTTSAPQRTTTTPPPPRAVITLNGSNPSAGQFLAVTLTVSSSDGTIPAVTVVSANGCTLTETAPGTLALAMPTYNIPFDGETCTVRASGAPAPGFTAAAPVERSIRWTPIIGYAEWGQPVRDVAGDRTIVHVLLTTTEGLYGATGLQYSEGCSGPFHADNGQRVEIVAPGRCTVTGETVLVNQTTWGVVRPLTIAAPG